MYDHNKNYIITDINYNDYIPFQVTVSNSLVLPFLLALSWLYTVTLYTEPMDKFGTDREVTVVSICWSLIFTIYLTIQLIFSVGGDQ